MDLGTLETEVKHEGQLLEQALMEMEKRLVGQRHVAESLLLAMLADGHVLLEGLPGLAKTTAIKTLGETAGLDFARVQFTPDLLPADILGTQIYDPRSGGFTTKKGPIFTNLLLSDEINRAPPKVQAALLEAMQERQVTLGDQSYRLDEPFLVLATQNPIEQEGTYPLPEAQTDRFLFKIRVFYGSPEDEMEILNRVAAGQESSISPVLSKEHILRMRKLTRSVHVAEKVRKYIVDIVFATREPKQRGLEDLASLIDYGASPRASLSLERAARARAVLAARAFVTPQDIKDVALDVLRHRILLSYEAEAEGLDTDQIIHKILERVDVP